METNTGTCARCDAGLDPRTADLTEDGPICARCAYPVGDPAVVAAEIHASYVRSSGGTHLVFGVVALLLGVLLLGLSAKAGAAIGTRTAAFLVVVGVGKVFYGLYQLGERHHG
jgi:hypothetical protein